MDEKFIFERLFPCEENKNEKTPCAVLLTADTEY